MTRVRRRYLTNDSAARSDFQIFKLLVNSVKQTTLLDIGDSDEKFYGQALKRESIWKDRNMADSKRYLMPLYSCTYNLRLYGSLEIVSTPLKPRNAGTITF